MHIFLKMNTGITITLDVELDDRIAAVKQKIQDKESYELDSFVMVFAGKPVGFNPGAQPGTVGSDPADDEKTLRDYGIEADCLLHGMYKLF